MTDMNDPTSVDAAAAVLSPFDPGTNVLVVDEDGDNVLPFSLSQPDADGESPS